MMSRATYRSSSMEAVTSKDGTRIAYDRTGHGRPVILVAGAFSYRKYPGQVKLALQEPAFVVEPGDRKPPADHLARVSELIAAGDRGAAVKYFMTDGMGAPSFVIPILKAMPGAWAKLTAVAHTLLYHALLCEGYQSGQPLPAGEWDAVTMPTLVMSGTERESPASLYHAAAAVAGALPTAELVVRKGLGHAKKLTPKVIAATLTEFFGN
jgi:pimeloyl-ACP methyl ester carboxylesterase